MLKNALEYLLLRIFLFFFRLMPFSLVQRFGELFGIFIYRFVPYRRKVALENLRKSFPEKSDDEIKGILRGAYINLAITLFEFSCFQRLKPSDFKKFVTFENLEVVLDALNENRGLILMSGHFGNWELSAMVTGLSLGKPLNIIVKRQRNRLVDFEINRWRCLFGNKVIPMEKAFREALRILPSGGIIAMLADQSAPKESIYVNFLGRPASTFAGPAVMALKTGAPMVMGFAIRENFKYKIVFERLLIENVNGSDDEKIIKITQIHTSTLEKYIRKYPDHWLWFHRRWKHTPSQT